MRHRVSGTKFNVDKDHRDSLLKNLLTSYIKHGQMVTTSAKAKALKSMFDKVVTRAKKNDLQARRMVGALITDRPTFIKFFEEVIPKLSARTSGYSTTQLIIAPRAGDSSKMMKIAMILDIVPEEKVEKKTTRKLTKKIETEAVADADPVVEGEVEEKKTTRKRTAKKAEQGESL